MKGKKPSANKAIHLEKRVPKQHPYGCYLAVHNLALLGVLFWYSTKRGVLFAN